MIPQLRNRRKIYVCNATITDKVKKYDEPIKLYENCQVTSGVADLERFGLEAYQYMRIKTNATHAKYYHIGDAVYVNVEPPEEHDDLCRTADYVVSEDPIQTFNALEVLLRRRSGRK